MSLTPKIPKEQRRRGRREMDRYLNRTQEKGVIYTAGGGDKKGHEGRAQFRKLRTTEGLRHGPRSPVQKSGPVGEGGGAW